MLGKISKFTFITLLGCTSVFAEEGFTKIFNGKDFEGWYLKVRQGGDAVAKQVFTVNEKGWVHVFADPFEDGHELDTGKNDTHGMFFSDKSYSRYVLRFEYKWGKKRTNNFGKYQYDAGFFYHVYNDKIWPDGIEYQIRYNHLTKKNHTGDFWAIGKSRFQWHADENGHFLLPSKGGKPKPIKRGEHLAKGEVTFHALDDQWNQCEVIVMADKYAIHKLNGEIVNLGTGLNLTKGKIGFQSETAEIFYRNIRIKEFKEDVPMEKFLK